MAALFAAMGSPKIPPPLSVSAGSGVCLGLTCFSEGVDLDRGVVGGCPMRAVATAEAPIFVPVQAPLVAAIPNR